MLLPGQLAACICRQAAELLARCPSRASVDVTDCTLRSEEEKSGILLSQKKREVPHPSWHPYPWNSIQTKCRIEFLRLVPWCGAATAFLAAASDYISHRSKAPGDLVVWHSSGSCTFSKRHENCDSTRPEHEDGALSGLTPESRAPLTSKPARLSHPFEILVKSAHPTSIYKFVSRPISRSLNVSCRMASVQKCVCFFSRAVSFCSWLDQGYDTFARICTRNYETFFDLPWQKSLVLSLAA